MRVIHRRLLLAAGGTLAAGLPARKPRAAEELEDLSALKPTVPPKPPPEVMFTTADGTEHHLSEYKGRGMVVNFWATWCNPCIAELPALDALSLALGPHDIAVMPLSSDRGGAATVQKFYGQHGIAHLPVLLDPKGAAAQAWRVRGIPTTFIIGRDGLEHARLEGAADWATGADLIVRLVG
jgi:thiol-disulfide isomerase/thioredoxin